MTRILSALAALIAALSCFPAAARAVISLPTDFASAPVVGGLDQPTSMAFLPDGRLLFTEQRTGRVRMVVNGHLAATDPVVTVPQLVATGNEQGLLAIAVDPGWPSRPYVYLYHDRTGGFMRLVRYTASGDVSNPLGENLTLCCPLLVIDDIPDQVQFHNGGALRFGPDGHMYLSMGEDTDQCGAQDSTTLKGELLHLDVSRLPAIGTGPVPRALLIAPDHPLVSPDSNAMLVWAYGMRNPFRFHVDPVTGLVYLADVGETSWEELDEVHPGDNLGWPLREGFASHIVQGSCTEPPGALYRDPLIVYDHSQGNAIVATGVYRPAVNGNENWPIAYHGDVFYSDYYTGFLRRLKKTGGTWAPAPAPGQPNADDWATGLASIADGLVGPDGALWCLRQFDDSFSPQSGSITRIRSTATVGVAESRLTERPLSGAPNPFTGHSVLAFTLAARAPVRLSVYDLGGRRIAVLFEGEARAGETRVTWSGADEGGRPVAPGLYLARLERPEGTETVRLMRLR